MSSRAGHFPQIRISQLRQQPAVLTLAHVFKGNFQMPSDKADDKNLHELDQLLGEPPLLKGEDKARYMKYAPRWRPSSNGARHRPTPRKRSYSVRPALPFWGHFPCTLSPRVSSVERMRSPRAAGCFVRVGVRSKISVKSVDGAPRQQDAYHQPHRTSPPRSLARRIYPPTPPSNRLTP